MLIVEIKALPNGAHSNQTIDSLPEIPEGWAVIPAHLEDRAMGYLPFINLVFHDGEIVDVEQGEVPEAVREALPRYTTEQLIRQEITDLELSGIEQGQAITDLELMILEGYANV